MPIARGSVSGDGAEVGVGLKDGLDDVAFDELAFSARAVTESVVGDPVDVAQDRTDWMRMNAIAKRWLPPARVLHPWPNVRFDARTQGKRPVR